MPSSCQMRLPSSTKWLTGHWRRFSLAPSCMPMKPCRITGAWASRRRAVSRASVPSSLSRPEPGWESSSPERPPSRGAPVMRNMSARLKGALLWRSSAAWRKAGQRPSTRGRPLWSRPKPSTASGAGARVVASRRADMLGVRLMMRSACTSARRARAQACSSWRVASACSGLTRRSGTVSRGLANCSRPSVSAYFSRQSSVVPRPALCRSCSRGWLSSRSPKRFRLMTRASRRMTVSLRRVKIPVVRGTLTGGAF